MMLFRSRCVAPALRDIASAWSRSPETSFPSTSWRKAYSSYQTIPKLRLMPLGGSVTAGVGSSDHNGYRGELVKLLKAANYDVEVVGSRKLGSCEDNCHEGWRGFRLDEIDKKARRCVSKLQPNIFTINAGSNDCLQDFQLDEIGDRMQRLLEYLWETCPDSVVVLSTLIINRDPKVDKRIARVNEAYHELVEGLVAQQRRIVLADMHSAEGLTLEDLTDDGTHPGDEGYKKMAEIWLEAIEDARDYGFLG